MRRRGVPHTQEPGLHQPLGRPALAAADRRASALRPVNGFLLGRYREIGPQVTLYRPAPLLSAGGNMVTVLELERLGGELELRDRPEPGPPEEYVEEFD